MANSELKPCPFCGGEGVAFRFGVIEEYGVRCDNCGASTDDQFDSLDAAIKAWNTRAERTCRPNPIYDRIFECDVCGEMDTDGIPDYCPGCGARVIHE